MPVGPDSSIDLMRRAVAYTSAALGAAADIDITRTDEDRAFFTEEKEKLIPISAALAEADNNLTAFELGPGLVNQVKVTLGDVVLDRCISDSAARTKLELKNSTGLGADHIFGRRSDSLAREPLRFEPTAVRSAAARFDDVPDFPGKEQTKQQLIDLSNKQDELIDARDDGYSERDRLKSTITVKIIDAANALAATHAALQGRFVRQRSYVSSFFLR